MVLIPVLNEKDNSNRIFSTIIANRAGKSSQGRIQKKKAADCLNHLNILKSVRLNEIHPCL